MSQQQQLKFAQSEINRSKRWRNQENYDDNWKRWIDLYRGRQYEGQRSVNDRLIVNIIFATKNVLGPAVAINNPKFTVAAVDPKSQAQAMLTTEILNYMWRTHRYQSEFRLTVDDFLLIGHGWVKCGYKFVKEPKVKKVDAESSNSMLDEDAYNEGIDDREDKEGNSESELIVQDDRPYVERISPFDIFVDPDARHPKEMRWIAQRTWRPLYDVQVDERYSATARKKVGAKSWSRWNATAGDGDARDSSEGQSGGLQYAEIFEFYDLKRKTVSTFAMDGTTDDGVYGSAGFLIKPEEIPYGFGSPFVMLRNFEVPDHFYPIGDVEQIESLQFELNETRNQMMNHRKRFARKWIYNRDAFDRDGVTALESDIDNAMIPVVSDDSPDSVIAPIPAVITPPEFYNQSDLISTDMDRVSGVSDYQRGAQTAIKRTATEAAMIQDASNARAQDRLAKVEDVLAQVGERVIGLMQQFMTGKKVARIISLPGANWLEYDKDYLQGNFDFYVVGGSTEPQNETFKRQSSMQLVDASMPFMQEGVADMVRLYRKVLDGFGITDPNEYISEEALAAKMPQEEEMPPEEGMPPQGAPPQGAVPPIPPEIMEMLPPEIQQGIMDGSIPPEMVEQMLMEITGQQPAGAAPMGPPPQGAVPPIPPEILEMLPPDIQQGIMDGSIPPEMVEQILMEITGQQPAGAAPMGPPPPPMM